MSSGACVICLEPLVGGPSGQGGSEPIGVSVPCGHCLHVACWESWAASRLGCRDAKCPSCNQSSTTFVRLYADLGGDVNDDNDDDLSLSSCESVTGTKLDDEINDAAESSHANAADDEMAHEGENEVECLDLTEIDDTASSPSVEILEVPSGVVAVPREIETKRPWTTKQSAATGAANDRYKRMAKRLKQQVAMLGSKQQEFGQERGKLVKLLQTQTEELVERKRLMQQVEDEQQVLERNLDTLKLAVVQSKRQHDELSTLAAQARHEADEAKSMLRDSEVRFQRKLECAKAMSMPEVQRMNEEVRTLREQVKILQRQRRQTCPHPSTDKALPPTGRSQPVTTLKATQQLLRELSQSREQGKPASASSTTTAHRLEKPVDTQKLSSHAHRMRAEMVKPRARKAPAEALSILDATDNIPSSMEPILPSFLKANKVRRTSVASAPPRSGGTARPNPAPLRIRHTSAMEQRTLSFAARR